MTTLRSFESRANNQRRSDVSSFARTMSRGANSTRPIHTNNVSQMRMTTSSLMKKNKQFSSHLSSPLSSPSLVAVLGSSSAKKKSQSSNYLMMTKPRPSPTKQRMTPSSTGRSSNELGIQIGSPTATPTYYTTPIQSPEKNTRRHFVTPPSLTRSRRNDNNISQKTKRSSCHVSSGDRFIPNRSQMRVDLCRASLASAEKKRLNFIERKVTENDISMNDNGETGANGSSRSISVDSTASTSSVGGSANDSSTGSTPNTSAEILTPIQSEYRARMRGALLSLPIDARSNLDSVFSTSTIGTGGGGISSGVGNAASVTSSTVMTSSLDANIITPRIPSRNDRSNLAYAYLPDSESENIVPNRMLSFSGNMTDGSFSSLSSQDKGCNNDNDCNYHRSNNKSKTTIRHEYVSPPWVVTPDPFTHDQLRVLDRSSFGNSASPLHSFENNGMSAANKVTRRINTAPTRILDAPELVDDYYLNLISWGTENILAVALGQCVYLWNAASGDINHLLTLPGAEDFVTSVKWAESTGNTNYLAVGTNDGPVQLWDTEAMRKVRSLGGHAARVGSLDWNQHWLSSGGRDSIIIQHDVRSAQHITSTYAGHTQEVCGLAWSEDGTTLASGGNENYLCIWDAAMSTRRNNSGRHSNRIPPRLTLTQHLAAVKALAWCPFHRGLLASGGGTADRTIKFWNSNSGAVLNSIDTGSQVCSLLWSKHQRELCSSHGFSENQLILWRYPNMTKIQEFKGHTARVCVELASFSSMKKIELTFQILTFK